MTKLPTEMIAEILSLLPPKSLCRFKSVAKSWHFPITSDAFIKLHLIKTLNSQSLNLIICRDSSTTISAGNPNDFSFSAVDHPVKSLHRYATVQFIGSCRGILCIADVLNNTVFYFNPSTKTHRLIPPSPSDDQDVDFGFGYDCSVDDYKLLKIIWCYVNGVKICREIRLYSMRSNSWKNVKHDLGDYSFQERDVVHVNGVLYFPVHYVNDISFVKSFDLKTERFSDFEMFELDKSFEFYSFVSVDIGGCFAVMVNYGNKHWSVSSVELWVRKEVSWNRVFRVSDLSKIGGVFQIKPVIYSKDGGRVLLELDWLEFCWLDWRSNEFTRVKARGLPTEDPRFDTYTFVPSIVSLRSDEGKANDEHKSNDFSRF